MTEKITSAEAYEHFKNTPFQPLGGGNFDRIDVERHLKVVGEINDFIPPSGKSFLDWARREELVETVSRGVYRWTTVTEAEAADVGRKLAEADQGEMTDDYPEAPMVLDTEDDEFLDAFSDLINHLVESFEEAGDEVQRTADAIEAHAQAYQGNVNIVVDNVPRLPRKMKKQMKQDLVRYTAAQKVTFSFDPVPS